MHLSRKAKHSLLLIIYLLICFAYYFVGDIVRLAMFPAIVLIVLLASVRINHKSRYVFKLPKKVFNLSVVTLILSFSAALSGTITPFWLYILLAPLFAYFIYNEQFSSKLIINFFYCVCAILILVFLKDGNFDHLWRMSRNYVSHLLIVYIALIFAIQYNQNERINVLPSVLGFFISVLATGRSGIIAALLVMLAVIMFTRSEQGRFKGSLPLIIIAAGVTVALNLNEMLEALSNITFFERFSERGVKSPSRMIIIREYFAHLNQKTILTGYNFTNNFWFQHYGLNPHNSFLRLHHYAGSAFFVITPLLLISLIKLTFQNKYLAVILFAILLRSYTDSTLFLTFYDFIPFIFIIFAFYNKSNNHFKTIL